jgi:predicted NodU family carbamoyl transferase
VLNDGKIDFFCKEERISRKKRDKHPFKSLELLKNNINYKLDSAIYSVPSNNEPDIETVYSQYINKTFNVELENFSSLMHHLSHASLAYFNSKFETCLVFVIDRNGSIYFLNNKEVARESESVYLCDKNTFLSPLQKNFWMYPNTSAQRLEIKNSLENLYSETKIVINNFLGIVKVYEAATTMIGQDPLENGKTMGLSSYGEYDKNYKLFNNSIPISEFFSDTYPVSFF